LDTCATIQFMAIKGNNPKMAYLLTVDGAALTKARFKSQLSMEDVVQQLGVGVNKSSVSRWEQGVLNPSPERLWKLVDIFGTQDFIRLNGKAVLTAEEIEVVRKLREG
jgi:transcriptional regulator with XRE-family HTH domain